MLSGEGLGKFKIWANRKATTLLGASGSERRLPRSVAAILLLAVKKLCSLSAVASKDNTQRTKVNTIDRNKWMWKGSTYSKRNPLEQGESKYCERADAKAEKVSSLPNKNLLTLPCRTSQQREYANLCLEPFTLSTAIIKIFLEYPALKDTIAHPRALRILE